MRLRNHNNVVKCRVYNAINREKAGGTDELKICFGESGRETKKNNFNANILFQTGDSALHTSWYINDKGDKVWLKFDANIPCNMFPTHETRWAMRRGDRKQCCTRRNLPIFKIIIAVNNSNHSHCNSRFYKPKLHKIEKDPYAEKKVHLNFSE